MEKHSPPGSSLKNPPGTGSSPKHPTFSSLSIDIEKQEPQFPPFLSTISFISVINLPPGLICYWFWQTNFARNHPFLEKNLSLCLCITIAICLSFVLPAILLLNMYPVRYTLGLKKKWYGYPLKSFAEICGFGVVWAVHYFNIFQDVYALAICCMFMLYFLGIELTNHPYTYPFFFNLFGCLTLGMTAQVLGTKYSSLGVLAYVCFLTLLRNGLNTIDFGADNSGTNNDDNNGNNNATNSNSIE